MSYNIRSVLESLCTIFSDNGITCIKAEVFRQAKYDEDRATELMWRVLYDAIIFYKATTSTLKGSAIKLTSQADMVYCVKSHFQNWGYLSKSFAELPSDLSRGSRELLLALGWLIHSKDIIGKIISQRSGPLQRKLNTFIAIPELASLLSYPYKASSRALSAKQQLQRQLMMCGKLRMALRRLYASLQQAAKLKKEIHHYTRGSSLQPELDHLTPLEVYLLRHPNKLKEMYQELTTDNTQLKNLLDWKAKEHMFWEWMDSVLKLHIEEMNNKEKFKQELSTTESVFLAVPTTIADDISHMRTQLRDFILQHEEEMYKLDKMLANKKASQEEMEIAAHRSEKELCKLNEKLSESVVNGKESHLPLSSTSQCSPSFGRTSGVRSSAAYSMESTKKNKKAEILDMMKEEIENLQQQVTELESELKEKHLNNVHKFQSILREDANSICILPRFFKQFSNT